MYPYFQSHWKWWYHLFKPMLPASQTIRISSPLLSSTPTSLSFSMTIVLNNIVFSILLFLGSLKTISSFLMSHPTHLAPLLQKTSPVIKDSVNYSHHLCSCLFSDVMEMISIVCSISECSHCLWCPTQHAYTHPLTIKHYPCSTTIMTGIIASTLSFFKALEILPLFIFPLNAALTSDQPFKSINTISIYTILSFAQYLPQLVPLSCYPYFRECWRQ